MTIDRYHRQTLLPQIGQEGQARLRDSRVLLVGCGALGCIIADQLARAGVGHIRIADRDVVELANLHRQVLFDESDAQEGLPKAVAAADRLRRINSQIEIEPRVVDVDADNVEALAEGVQIILDGTDNVSTRYLINDVAVKLGVPWVHGACVGTEGRMMTIRPGVTPCLRCLYPQMPDVSQLATCDTAGVLGAVAVAVGAMQAAAAIKLLSGNMNAIAPQLLAFDLWTNCFRSIALDAARRDDCAACGLRRFDVLESRQRDSVLRLCGRRAVQIRPAGPGGVDLPGLARRLRSAGQVQLTAFLVRCKLSEPGLSLTIFPDGRTIVEGTDDMVRARSIHARYVGS